MGRDLLRVAQQTLALWVLLHEVHGAAEVRDLAVWREDLSEEQIDDGSLDRQVRTEDTEQSFPNVILRSRLGITWERHELTVSPRPARMKPKLKLC